tara:strand:- start:10054 stop:11295 length:1242 start_codon:yes stop_codon:yes gene_type:complete
MFKNALHQAICKNLDKLEEWYDKKSKEVPFAITTSIDVRDAEFKISSVDANIYPAGFNNICEADRNSAPEIFQKFVNARYGNIKNILLLSEEHTNNPYYWENVYAFSEIIQNAGYEIRISMPVENLQLSEMQTSGGKTLQLTKTTKEGSKLVCEDGFEADLVISNNDFSDPHQEWAQGLDLTMNPPRELGWYQRKKSTHFKHFQSLVNEFAATLDLDPWLLSCPTKSMMDFDTSSEQSKAKLAALVDEMLAEIRSKYDEYNIAATPSVFIKNNAGTYGLAVTQVQSGDEVTAWNNKIRKKMKAAKGGGKVTEIILQEGIPSKVKSDGDTAEPVIYMFGSQLIGGFFRTHSKKGESESLNSPGAVYRRLCMTDLRMEPDQHLEENVYGWLARLSSLAVAYEAKEMGVKFKNYQL